MEEMSVGIGVLSGLDFKIVVHNSLKDLTDRGKQIKIFGSATGSNLLPTSMLVLRTFNDKTAGLECELFC